MEYQDEPDDEEIEEINKFLSELDQKKEAAKERANMFTFNSKDHFIGWLRTNGIKW